MKAVLIYKYGGPEVLEYTDAPIPEIKPDEVLIKVIATSINPVDYKVRKGLSYPRAGFPAILGWDVSGVIEKAGSDVHDFKPGDEVYARPNVMRDGTYAEYVAVQAKEISAKPKKLDHLQSASIPLAGLTAWQGLFDHGKLKAGQRILINGAAGGVGTLAVQLAKWKGAYVIGTASENNIDFLKELGTDEVINYKKQKVEEVLKDMDVVFDTIGGDAQVKLLQVMKPGGILVSTVGLKDEEAIKAKGMHGVKYVALSIPADLKHLADLADEGKLKPVIAKILPLTEIREAHELIEKGHVRGKIVITI